MTNKPSTTYSMNKTKIKMCKHIASLQLLLKNDKLNSAGCLVPLHPQSMFQCPNVSIFYSFEI